MLQAQEISEHLKNHAHAAVPCPLRREDFERAIGVFFEFLKLPRETKERAFFQVRPDDRGSEVGYRRYLRTEGRTDDREYVHYHRLAEERFRDLRADIPELDTLLRAMRNIHNAAVGVLEGVIRTLDERHSGLHNAFFDPKRLGNFYLRFLKYDRAAPGTFLAKGHYDRGSCTLALAESGPGLRMGIDDQHLKDVTHRDGEALFFPGLKFGDVTSNAYAPTWHDVVQKDGDAFGADIARWAIVLFADPSDMPLVTYDEAHTPLRVS